MARILHDGRTYRPYEYEDESEFEQAVIDYSRDVFGPESVYFDVKKRLDNQRVLTIPDGYLLDFSFHPRLYIIENELANHDAFRHIGQQLLKFDTAYENSRRKLKKVLLSVIKSDDQKREFIEGKIREGGFSGIRALLDHVIWEESQAHSIIVINEVTSDLKNVLGGLTMDTDVAEFKTYASEEDPEDHIHIVKPFQQDVRKLTEEGSEVDPQDLNTVVVPARDEGFEKVFLGENRWYKIGMDSAMTQQIEYIAAYRTAPESAITHYAEVASIEKYQDSGKYVLNFKGPAKEFDDPIGLPEGDARGLAPQGRQYTTFKRLREADDMRQVFP